MKYDILWVLQKNFISEKEYLNVRNQLMITGAEFQDIELVPFKYDVQDLWDADHYIFQGTTALVMRCWKNRKYRKHLFFDKENFKYMNLAKYGDLLLNNNLQLMKSYRDKDSIQFDYVFIRPTDDSKAFTGHVVSKDDPDICTWIDRYGEVIVSSVKEIDAEWRFFIVDKKVITGCQYHKNGRLCVDKSYPKEAIETIEKAIDIWTPHDIFVMDIGLCDNQYKIVEVGCFNAAGFYQCDTWKIVEAVHNYLRNHK